MKAIVFIDTSQETKWVEKLLPGEHPWMLSILNKPLIAFYLDFFKLAGCTEIRIVQADDSVAVGRYLDDGSLWGMNVSYTLARSEDSIKKVLRKNSAFIGDDSCFFVRGLSFLRYEKERLDFSFAENDVTYSLTSAESSFLVIKKGFDFSHPITPLSKSIKLVAIDRVKVYFELSMAVLDGERDHYFLPGYTAEPDAFIGQNVEIDRGTDFEKPIAIGDNVKLFSLTLIGPLAILGDNVIIDKRSSVKRSIIYNGTYVGPDLDIDNMILYRNKLISPESEVSIPLTDFFLAAPLAINPFQLISNRIIAIVFSFFLTILLLPFVTPVLFVQIFLQKTRIVQKELIINEKGDRAKIFAMVSESPWMQRIIHFTMTDIFLFLPLVFQMKVSVVGNKMVSPKEWSSAYKELKKYSPGLFSLLDIVVEHEGVNNLIHERYYINHKSILYDIHIVFHAIMRRLVT